MKNKLLAAILIIAIAAVSAIAEDEDEKPFPFAFQGRVGVLVPNAEEFDNGAIFEVGGMMHLSGPIYLTGFGGLSNFDFTGEPTPLTEEYANWWSQYKQFLDSYEFVDVRYRVNFVGGGIALTMNMGSLEPVLNAGVAAYQVSFVSSFNAVESGIPGADGLYYSTEDSEWFFGYNLGGGLYYRFNDIISFGAQGTYHIIDTEAMDDFLTVTFGMNIKIPE